MLLVELDVWNKFAVQSNSDSKKPFSGAGTGYALTILVLITNKVRMIENTPTIFSLSTVFLSFKDD